MVVNLSRYLRNCVWILCTVLCILPQSAPAWGQSTARDRAATILRQQQRDALAGGIQDDRYVKIGGIEQWISVRGRHPDAPIILFLHGGPGFSSIPTSWRFLQSWEEDYVLAQWDQRGAGKTYEINQATRVQPTMSVERMLADAEEVTQYLRTTYHRPKIVLVGYSWGSILGAMLAQRHPDWFSVYVGIGQVVDFPSNERLGYEATIAAAQAAHDDQAIKALRTLSPFPDSAHPDRNLEKLVNERQVMAKYHGIVWHGEPTDYDRQEELSPDYTSADFQARNAGIMFSLRALWGQVQTVSFTGSNKFKLPVVFLHGRHDLNASAQLMSEWFPTLEAPSKKLIWFEDSGHYVYEEEPAKALLALIRDVLPFAVSGQRESSPAEQ
jgi:pimeloyl-ACP methyl ester carboxylesterase